MKMDTYIYYRIKPTMKGKINKLLKALALALVCTVLGVFIYSISWLLATHRIPMWLILFGVVAFLTFFIFYSLEDD